MGKKNQKHKFQKGSGGDTNSFKKLSPQKRHEVNDIIGKLLKLTSIVQTSSSVNKEWEHYLDIEKLISKVKSIEPEMKFNTDSRSGHFSGIINWIQRNNGIIKDLSVSEFPGMEFGIQADRDFQEGELVCSIPQNLMLTLEAAEESVLQSLIKTDPMLQHMSNVVLALFLIIEYDKGEDSFWHPYIASLPHKYNTVLYFSSQEFQLLKGSPVLEPALKQCKHIARQYAYLNKLFQTSNDVASLLLRDIFTYQLYCWAVSTVMTRQNYIPSSDGERSINALIPFWDMCNHTNGYLTTEYKKETKSSDCFACQNFVKGEQVLIYYGSRSNADFLVHNGFVFPRNDHDTYRLRLGISKADPLQPLRVQLLDRLGVPSCDDFYLKTGSEPVDGRLLAFLRVFNMDTEHLEHWIESDRCSDLMYIDCALDTEVETKAWNFLLNRIKLLLYSYSVNALDDSVEIGDTTSCRHIVVLQLSLEKKLLQSALDYVCQRIKA